MSDSCGEFENILRMVGELGRWQLLHCAWALLIGILTAAHNMSSVFIASVPEHHCSLPEGGELEDWLPIDETTGNFSQCYIKSALGSNVSVQCSSYVYTMEEGASSVVSDWDLVCSNRWKASTVLASYMFGAFCGAPLWGAFSDQFGRKRALVACGVIFAIGSISAAFSNNYATFITLRLVSAVADNGLFNSLFVFYMEIIGPKWRALIGMLYQVPYAVGFLVLPGVAYLEKHWRYVQLVISVPALLMLSIWWVLPESPRWLIMQGRLEEALVVLKSAAARNRRQLPPDEHVLKMMAEFRQSEVEEGDVKEQSLLASCASGAYKMFELVRTPKMRRNCLATLYSWLAVSIVYYGISLDTAKLSDSPHLAIFIGGLAEIAGVVVSVPFMNRYGRRILVSATHLISGITILCILTVPEALAWPKLVLGTIGKFSSGATYAFLFVYSAEYFPTKLRTAGIGAASTAAMIGSMLTSYIADLLNLVHWTIPSCVFGVFGITAALVTLLLPETAGRRLPDTVEDVETGRWELVEVAAG